MAYCTRRVNAPAVVEFCGIGRSAKMMKKISIGVLVVVVVLLSPIICGVVWLGCVIRSNAHPVMGENVARVDWLPAAAANVSFYKSYSFTAYEFDISEDGFVALAEERKWKLSEIGEEGIRIVTYRMGRKMREKYLPAMSDVPTDEQFEAYCRAMEIVKPTVSDGLTFEVLQANGGGITVVYDRAKQRAYVQTQPR